MGATPIDFEGRFRQRIGRAARAKSVAIRYTESELLEIETAAKAADTTLREWSRAVLLREARRAPDDALFTELVATRLLLTNLIKPLLLGKPMPEDWITKAMAGVREAKHKAAADLRKEYEARARKES
jgi:hypothetical protein